MPIKRKNIGNRCSSENDLNPGRGYATLIKSELEFEFPNQYSIYNRGVSGDRVIDIYARIKLHIINFKPDILSILVGVNDVSHEVLHHSGIDADKYFKLYSMMIEEIKEALPDVKIMILEPFVLEGPATKATEEEPERWKYYNTEVRKRAQKAKEVAEKYNLAFVPLQDKFDEATKLAPNEYWIRDGVHPTTAGYELIKREWLKCFYALEL